MMLCSGYIGMNCVISEQCFYWIILQRKYKKMTIPWNFYNSFVKFHGKKTIVSHKITMFSPNLCYNEVCYKRTALYFYILSFISTFPRSHMPSAVARLIEH